MQKIERETRRQLLSLGLTVLSVDVKSGKTVFEVQAPNGKQSKFYITNDDGDPRAAKNNMRDFRLFASQNAGPMTALAAALAPLKPMAPQPMSGYTLPPVQSIAPTQEEHAAGLVDGVIRTPTLPGPPIPVTIDDNEPSPTPVPKEPTMAPKTTRTQVRRLSSQEFYKLCEWLKTQDPTSLQEYIEIARLASRQMALSVAPTTIKEAMEAVGLPLAPLTKKDRVRTDRTAIVAKNLIKVMRALGMPEDLELLAVAERRSLDA